MMIQQCCIHQTVKSIEVFTTTKL